MKNLPETPSILSFLKLKRKTRESENVICGENFDSPSFVKESQKKTKLTPLKQKVETFTLEPSENLSSNNCQNWLENPKDEEQRKVNDPDYDPTSLYIPPNVYKKFTPAQKQYWDIKRRNFDTIILFKLGKFYELFEKDAEVAVQLLNLQYMGGKRLHCGFPESAFDKYMSKLIKAGYKVGRVEQMETPEEAKGKKSSVVERKLCEVLSLGMLQDPERVSVQSNSVLLFFEAINSKLQVALIELTNATLKFCEFTDNFSKDLKEKISSENKAYGRSISDFLKTILSQTLPVEIYFSKKYLAKSTKSLLKQVVLEIFSNHERLKVLGANCSTDPDENYRFEPVLLSKEIEKKYSIFLNLVLSFLKSFKVDSSILKLAKLEELKVSNFLSYKSNHLVLDAATINSLNLYGEGKSLFTFLNFCKTAAGQRKLKDWLTFPSVKPDVILGRQRSVSIFNEKLVEKMAIKKLLGELPDIERVLVHLFNKSSNSSDQQAVFYSGKASENTVKLFSKLFYGLKITVSILETTKKVYESSISTKESQLKIYNQYNISLVKNILNSEHDIFEKCLLFAQKNLIPLQELITYYEKHIDFDLLMKENCISPILGIDSEFDDISTRIEKIHSSFEDYLLELRESFKCEKIKYYFPNTKTASILKTNNNTRKERFQIEIPSEILGKNIPDDFEVVSQKSGFRRFHSEKIKYLLKELIALEDNKVKIQNELTLKVFREFCLQQRNWRDISSLFAELDVLCSFSEHFEAQDFSVCLPKLDLDTFGLNLSSENRVLKFENIWLPGCNQHTFVRNNISFSSAENFLILTGPNMGGKSTLLRALSVSIILAHMGCFVPATNAVVPKIDRVFTRIGAADNLIAGKSTFQIELEETKAILTDASKASLVILDELGRGTSTKDGLAIAVATAKSLITENHSICAFATHYSSMDFYVKNVLDQNFVSCVLNGYMGFEIINENRIHFLYKLMRGNSEKSFANNAALMAGIPEKVLNKE